MPLQRFAPEDALLGERIPTTLTSGGDTPLHAEASWGRRRGQRETEESNLVPIALGRNHTQGAAGGTWWRVEHHEPARSCRAPPGERQSRGPTGGVRSRGPTGGVVQPPADAALYMTPRPRGRGSSQTPFPEVL